MRADTTHGHGPDRTDPRAPSSTPDPATTQPPSNGLAASAAMVGADGDGRRHRGAGRAGGPRRRDATGKPHRRRRVPPRHPRHPRRRPVRPRRSLPRAPRRRRRPEPTRHPRGWRRSRRRPLRRRPPPACHHPHRPRGTSSPIRVRSRTSWPRSAMSSLEATIRRHRTRATRRAPTSSSPRPGPTTAGSATPISLRQRSRTNGQLPTSTGSSPSGRTTSR
jgi:hypothetical protein